jgi:hypothetical protein
MYPLPKFVSKTVASQASAPRDVSLLSVAGAVLGGLDCIIYVVSGVWGSETPSSSIPDLSAALWAHRSGRKDFAQVV